MYWKPILFGLSFCCLCTNARPNSSNNNHAEGNMELKKQMSKGRLSFAVNLLECLHHHANADENIIISPINMYAVLAMAHLASAGTTREAFADVLGLPKDNNLLEVHQDIGKLLKYLQEKKEYAVTDLTLANGIFVQKDYPLLTTFTDQVHKYFESEAVNVDFGDNAKEATDFINKWVSEKTKGQIGQLYSSPVDSTTKLILAGSAYFSGRWKEHFPKYLTKTEKFYTGVKDIEVQLMNNVKDVPYYDDPLLQFEAIQIPYDGHEYSMAIFLPYKSQTLMNFTHYLKPENVKKVFNESTVQGINYKIPRMNFMWKNSVTDALSMMGLQSVFEKSDLSNMVTAKDLRISDVNHGATMKVDEDGTEASAITTLQVVTYSLPVPPRNPKEFFVNRPFMAAIYHQRTSSIIFMALVHQPTV